MTIAPNDQRYPEFTIGWRLRLARTRLGPEMDAGQFADLIEVSRNTVTNYELERTTPERMKPMVLKQWALATGVDLEWIRTGERPAVSPTPGGGEKLILGGGRLKGRWRPEQDSNLQPTGSVHNLLHLTSASAA